MPWHLPFFSYLEDVRGHRWSHIYALLEWPEHLFTGQEHLFSKSVLSSHFMLMSTMIRGILVLLLWVILSLLFSMLTLLVYAHWGSLEQPAPAFLFQGCSRIQITLDLGRSVRTESHLFLNFAQYLFLFFCAVFQEGVGNDELFSIHLLKGGLFLPQETAFSLPSSPQLEHLSAAATLWLHLVIAVQTRSHKGLLKNKINSLTHKH